MGQDWDAISREEVVGSTLDSQSIQRRNPARPHCRGEFINKNWTGLRLLLLKQYPEVALFSSDCSFGFDSLRRAAVSNIQIQSVREFWMKTYEYYPWRLNAEATAHDRWSGVTTV
jgi:hypothetical protein